MLNCTPFPLQTGLGLRNGERCVKGKANGAAGKIVVSVMAGYTQGPHSYGGTGQRYRFQSAPITHGTGSPPRCFTYNALSQPHN